MLYDRIITGGWETAMRRPNIGATFKALRLGHFRDEAAYQRYRATYDAALAALPLAPVQTWEPSLTRPTGVSTCDR